MAIYVTSDLHGFSIEKFKQLLSVIGFTKNDWLYILGDVIDRNNDGGVAILLWLLEQPNVQLIRGNHEQMLLECRWAFEKIEEESISELTGEKLRVLDRWVRNGASPTIKSLRRLLHKATFAVQDIVDYIIDAPLCETVEVGGRSFVLCHSGFRGFDKNKKLSDYEADDLLWNRPCATDRYFDDAITIFGHTMTDRYGCEGRAFKTDTWIDIDVGGSHGRTPMFLRLDDMKEIYFDN